RTNVGFLLPVFFDHKFFGSVDLGHGIRNFEIKDVGGGFQPFGMRGALEDLAAIGAFAFEDAARIVKPVREDVEVRLVPRNELAVIPDDPFEAVIGLGSHEFLLRLAQRPRVAALIAHVSRLFQHFAAAGDTRYDLADRKGLPLKPCCVQAKRAFLVRSFRAGYCFCNIKTKYVNMADINVSKAAVAGAGLTELRSTGGTAAEPVWDIIELLFFAYRDFFGDPDEVLLKLSFGRAHHRVLHFVNRNPGMKVADLLHILTITHTSLC